MQKYYKQRKIDIKEKGSLSLFFALGWFKLSLVFSC